MKIIQKIEYIFRNLVVYPLLKVIFRNTYSDKKIDIKNIKSILILRYDRIGDMVVTTPVFHELKSMNSNIKIGVFASEKNNEIIKNNPNVDKIYIVHSNWWYLLKEIRNARKEKYDVIINFIFNRTSSCGIMSNLIGPKSFKVGQGNDKYKFYFNRLLKLNRETRHMSETLMHIIKDVFICEPDFNNIRYEIFLDKESIHSVDIFLNKHNLTKRDDGLELNRKYIIFNLSAVDAVRKISKDQIKGIIDLLLKSFSRNIVVVSAPNDIGNLKLVDPYLDSGKVFPFPDKGIASLLELAAVIKGAVCTISPDTSIVHFSVGVGIPVISFYTRLDTFHEWIPINIPNRTVKSEKAQPVSSIPMEEISNNILDFLKQQKFI